MIELKKNSARAQHFIKSYRYHLANDNGAGDLREIYGRYSMEKLTAFKNCVKLFNQLNGEGARFCGHNCNYFSYAFTMTENGTKYLIYLTGQNTYKIEF